MALIEWIDSEQKILTRTTRTPVPGGIKFDIDMEELGPYSVSIAGSWSHAMMKTWTGAVRGRFNEWQEEQNAPKRGNVPPPASIDAGEPSRTEDTRAGRETATENLQGVEESLHSLLVKQKDSISRGLAECVKSQIKIASEWSKVKRRVAELKEDLSVVEGALSAYAQKVRSQDSAALPEDTAEVGIDGGGDVRGTGIEGNLERGQGRDTDSG